MQHRHAPFPPDQGPRRGHPDVHGPITNPLVATTAKPGGEPFDGQMALDAPADTYWALGLGYQLIGVDPGSENVVVRLGGHCDTSTQAATGCRPAGAPQGSLATARSGVPSAAGGAAGSSGPWSSRNGG